jgi:predicted short-subunit dehydrogenase-like oxidoreductase (DUF2520 family)
MRIAFVGCGAAGRPLGAAWSRRGHEIGRVLGPDAEEAVRAMGAGRTDGELDSADVVVFATPDDVLTSVANEHPLDRAQVALHLSGALPSTVLAATGARTAGLHPLRAFADFESSLEALPRTSFFVEGEAVETAEALAKDLGEQVLRIDTEAKTLYHAAAAVASNYTVTLLSVALRLFRRAGIDEERGLQALVELARGSVENVGAVGLPQALTGPAARGDIAVIRDHVEALPGELRGLYLTLLETTIPVALAKGSLDEATALQLQAYIWSMRSA